MKTLKQFISDCGGVTEAHRELTKMGLKINLNSLYRWERGEVKPSAAYIALLKINRIEA